MLSVANGVEFRNKSPKQIVPALADQGEYVASESTFYRVLREEKQLAHRGRAKRKSAKRPTDYLATRPCQVWSWDITYLRGPIRGAFFYLYLYIDIWSRKLVGQAVHETEDGQLASELLTQALCCEGIGREGLVVHQDNGSPMTGATFAATMERLGIIPSFSRPRVSDDNPFSESVNRTMKYCPQYPSGPFASLEAAREWIVKFVAWYNNEHLHSGIGFVTPASRHEGKHRPILSSRRRVYAAARRRHPERWSGEVRAWASPEIVRLNPPRDNAGAST